MACLRAASVCLLVTIVFARMNVAVAQDEPALSANPVVGKLHDGVTRFLEGVAAGETRGAFDELLAGSPLAEQTAAVRTLIDKAKEIPDHYGAYRDSELVSAKRVGKDVVLLKYLYKCEKFPLVWHFGFYRDLARTTANGEDRWVVISVRFDTQIEGLGS